MSEARAPLETLRAQLREWNEVTGAMHALAIALGLMTEETDTTGRAKHVFWSNDPVGTFLYETLERLVALGVLEREEGEHDLCFRWNADFRGSWEDLAR